MSQFFSRVGFNPLGSLSLEIAVLILVEHWALTTLGKIDFVFPFNDLLPQTKFKP